jgi:hypothetical protein
LSRKVPHLVQKGQRFYFRMRVPEPLVEQYGKEVTKALGDVSKAQAAVMARQLAAEHAQLFLREKHRKGLAQNPPVPAPTSRAPAGLRPRRR